MKIDEKKLEHFYNLGLKYEKTGNFDGAVEAYQQALKIDPNDHGGIAIRLASMKRGEIPETAPRAYISTLFDQTAELFDYILVDQLDYDVPFLLRKTFEKILPEHQFEKLLDLGCGTGLSGEAFSDNVKEKVGVDLSQKMIEIAHEKGDYNKLYVGDVVEFVSKNKDIHDLIVATDVLPYIGKLEFFFKDISYLLSAGGYFGFSTEKLTFDTESVKTYSIGAYQRYAHNENYIFEQLSINKLKCVYFDTIIVRKEQGKPVEGQLFIAQKCAER
ncbi:methyltransferase domain-containing protein [Bartonella tamiae]|uniref:Methyltransferase type 11 domain-containing protein n=1 Tax=Bartonella tamiae Th239 TaxID=1094558 RepID=J0ZKF2_9HYPH|nr:methyltransferase domain-containing protein [Bartonella tamiae]EJF88833.1 hypothetical protein ME5_01384 [Bartonella tamiae Th239]EJF94917.1 hypothetical protein MEG_00498 [Bartonella tamiae Th307]